MALSRSNRESVVRMEFLCQDFKLTFITRYGNDRNGRMQVSNMGNCISDNYNLFSFECTGFHCKLTLLTLQTLLASIVVVVLVVVVYFLTR